MSDPGVIDQFLAVFSRYIDTGFGLVRGDVASLARILVALDVTLAALVWAWGTGEEVLARLVRKVLYVGAFAFLIGDFQRLAQAVFDSFAGLGLKASGAALSAADLLRPGRIAAVGVDAVRPMLAAAGEMAGFPAIFENAVQIVVVLAAALVVLAAFFVLAVQLFVTLVEFKLVTLAGFVLVPFGLFGRTAFLAERVLGAVMAAGVKVLVLAVITGVGSTLFEGFLGEAGGEAPDLDQVLALALGALSLLGLGIFGPAIASGLVSGGPQLGAGAAAATAVATGGLGVAGAAAVRSAGGALAAARARLAGREGGGWPPGGPAGGTSSGPGSGSGGPAGAGPTPDLSDASPAASEDRPPAWARRLRARQALAAGAAAAAHAVRGSDGAPGGLAMPLKEEDR